jgi:hypothetical protein
MRHSQDIASIDVISTTVSVWSRDDTHQCQMIGQRFPEPSRREILRTIEVAACCDAACGTTAHFRQDAILIKPMQRTARSYIACTPVGADAGWQRSRLTQLQS